MKVTFPPDNGQRSLTAPTRNPGLGRVLVLDDDPECLQLACTALSLAGFEVEGLADPRQLFERLDLSLPEALVLDRRLPADTGDMLAARLQGVFGPHSPPVILWTADTSRHVEAGLLMGLVNDVVVKCQQGVDVLVQRVINHVGWVYVGPGLMLKSKDASVLYKGKRGKALTEREVDFLYQLARASTKGLTRGQGKLLLLDPGASDLSDVSLNRVVSRFKRKLPPTLRAVFVTDRSQGWRLKL